MVVGERWVVQALLQILGLLGAQQGAQGLAGGPGDGLELGRAGWVLEVFDDGGRYAALAQQVQRLARGAALGVVVDRDGAHGRGFDCYR